MLARLAREPKVAGACLLDRRGARECLWACGELEEEAVTGKIDGAQFVEAVDGVEPVTTMTLLGLKFFRVEQELHTVHAVSQQRRCWLVVSAVPVGVLVTVFRWPVSPQQAVPFIQGFCDELRR